tara:strand:+ start:39653 stop:41314 length:1662 start_codon:yes stop_codon:yes gene_type:complete
MKILLFLTSILICFISLGQDSRFSHILSHDVKLTPRVVQSKEFNKVWLKTNFASPDILNKSEITKIKGKLITKIELVFTVFKEIPTFDQNSLNYRRLRELAKLAPELFQNDLTEWSMVGQTACTVAEDGDKYFHGFIITYRPESKKAHTKFEMDYIEGVFGRLERGFESSKLDFDTSALLLSTRKSFKDGVGTVWVPRTGYPSSRFVIEKWPQFKNGVDDFDAYLKRYINYPEKAIKNGIEGLVYVGFTVSKKGKVTNVRPIQGIGYGCVENVVHTISGMPDWEPGVIMNKTTTYDLRVIVSFSLNNNVSISLKSCRTDFKYMTDSSVTEFLVKDRCMRSLGPDSTIFSVFKRNRNWDDMMVVGDLTGSMSPYTAQLLVWHKLNYKANKHKVKQFTFFNDGDSMADRRKVIGRTGGIYHGKANSFEAIKALALKTMTRGSGGDCPENNIEATLSAINNCSDFKDIIMIADNFATPRDIKLLKKVNHPIHIIVCGAAFGINVEYLNIARETGGSIHTIEDDINNLIELNEGEDFEIGRFIYRIQNGKFVRLYKS